MVLLKTNKKSALNPTSSVTVLLKGVSELCVLKWKILKEQENLRVIASGLCEFSVLYSSTTGEYGIRQGGEIPFSGEKSGKNRSLIFFFRTSHLS